MKEAKVYVLDLRANITAQLICVWLNSPCSEPRSPCAAFWVGCTKEKQTLQRSLLFPQQKPAEFAQPFRQSRLLPAALSFHLGLGSGQVCFAPWASARRGPKSFPCLGSTSVCFHQQGPIHLSLSFLSRIFHWFNLTFVNNQKEVVSFSFGHSIATHSLSYWTESLTVNDLLDKALL